LLDGLALLGVLGDLERKGEVAEPKVLGRDEARQEDIDALAATEWHRHHSVCAWHTVQAADKVGEVVEHRQVVLDHYDVDLLREEPPNHTSSGEALLDIEVR